MAATQYEWFDDTGVFSCNGEAPPNACGGLVVAMVNELLGIAMGQPISSEELQRAKNRVRDGSTAAACTVRRPG